MDFINKAYGQVVDVFQSLTLGARITSALLLAIVVISLAFLFRVQVSSGDEYLFGNREFSNSELAAMESAFAAGGLNESEIKGYRMQVPRSQKNLYLQALNDANFQLEQHGGFENSAIVDSSSPFVTDKQREFKNKAAREKELALIVKRMRDIDNATVQIDEQRKSGLRSEVEKTALVAVQTTGGRALEGERVRAIRETIAGAVAGLDSKNITVTDMQTGLAYRGMSADGMPLASDSPYATHKNQYENVWKEKILRHLSAIPGVNVEVNVELNPQLRNEEISRKIDGKPVSVAIKESTKGETTKGAARGGRPGAVPNGVSNTAASLVETESQRSESELTENNSEQRLLPSTDHIVRTTAPLTPERVTASIDVPQSYFHKIWMRDNPPVEGEEPKTPQPTDLKKIEEGVIKKIEESIVNLLPSVPPGVDPYPQVVVTTYPDMPIAAPPAEDMVAQATTWLGGNWRTVGMILFGLFGLMMLRSMVRSAAPEPSEEEAAARLSDPAAEGDEDDDEEKEETNELKRRFEQGGPNLRSDLTQLVTDDPDAAAAVLSKWIGDAA
ncbi:hypothetical protein [Lignipirellula cremea]|uniref:Flagellar MS-ring protein n=1 Tax=Lignipirellula cremea TaxID=2528010 RepID=A0A518DQ47_9BACT|nr:hypothetical protein [Lignipirellula cremea]QDU93976.1 flagellar MS-ring protein [Lignipirellula cremea]